jgi:hypothetical protein
MIIPLTVIKKNKKPVLKIFWFGTSCLSLGIFLNNIIAKTTKIIKETKYEFITQSIVKEFMKYRNIINRKKIILQPDVRNCALKY